MVEIIRKDNLCKFINSIIKEPYTIACIGTYLRSDDRAALELCNSIANKKNADIVICEYGLENCIHEIVDKKPTKLAIFDAAIVKGGELNDNDIVVLTPEELETNQMISISTHSIPVKLIVKYMIGSLNITEILFIGIPVKNLEIGLEISPEVKNLIEDVTRCFTHS